MKRVVEWRIRTVQFESIVLLEEIKFTCEEYSINLIVISNSERRRYFLTDNSNFCILNFFFSFPGDIDDCIVMPTSQGQFTPLPEALCDVIMDLTSQGQSATIENIRVKLSIRYETKL